MTVPLFAHFKREHQARAHGIKCQRRVSAASRPPHKSACMLTALLLTWLTVLCADTASAESAEMFLSEPASYTDVLEAFAGRGLPDFRLSLGFRTITRSSTVQREDRTQVRAGTFTFRDFARHERTTKLIWMTAEIGLYRGLMLVVSSPFVLEDARTLDATPFAIRSGLLDHAVASSYDSRIRDGIPYVDLGLAYKLVDQFQHQNFPTWVVRFNAQIGTGKAMSPCLHGQSCFRGASRGTTQLQGETRFSFRHRLVEPYGGFFYAKEFVTTAGDNFWPKGVSSDSSNQQPPSRAGWTAGIAVIPWENRQRMQRLSVNGQLSSTYVSAGRDYSPLFDVLGTSPSLMSVDGNGSGTTARFTGITSVDAHVAMQADLHLMIRAAQYARFRFGLGVSKSTSHLITGAYPCLDSVTENGACPAGQTSPTYQAPIDRPGNRFRLTDIFALNVSASAAGQF